MRKFNVIQHSYHEFLGNLEKPLENREIGFVYIRPFIGQAVPGSPQDTDALILLPGPMAPTEKEAYPYLAEEVFLVGQYLRGDQPVIGLGLGALLLAEQQGGTVAEEPAITAGFTTAHKTEAGAGDPLAEAMDGKEVCLWHAGSATLPAGVAPLLVDDEGRWLAFRPHAKAYGLLFRPEIKPGILEDMLLEGRNLPDDVSAILEHARTAFAQGRTQEVVDAVMVALVSELALMQPHARDDPGFDFQVVDD